MIVLLNPGCQELCKYLKAANNFGSLILQISMVERFTLCNRFSLSSLKTTPEEEVIFVSLAGKHPRHVIVLTQYMAKFYSLKGDKHVKTELSFTLFFFI